MTNEVVKKQYKKDPKTGEGFGEDKKKWRHCLHHAVRRRILKEEEEDKSLTILRTIKPWFWL
jgi:hypothetical protein